MSAYMVLAQAQDSPAEAAAAVVPPTMNLPEYGNEYAYGTESVYGMEYGYET